MGFQRARKEEQKQERRRSILDVALAVYGDRSFTDTTMAEVAERAGLSKGTLYLYFKTKEELFLALLEEELEAWFGELGARFGAGEGASTAEVAAILAGSLARREALTRLLALLNGTLEHNIDEEAAIRFKQALAAQVKGAGALLEGRLPFLQAGQGAEFLVLLHALVVGLREMADPAPVVRRVLERPDLSIFRIDFAEALGRALPALLAGLELERGRAAAGGGRKAPAGEGPRAAARRPKQRA